MPTVKILTPVKPGNIYHIYNRGINYQNVFLNPAEYNMFLSKMKKYLLETCSLFAFALLPNHFHMLLRIHEKENALNNSSFSKQYSKLILSYTNTINFQKSRKGGLFQVYFRRIHVRDEDYLRKLVFYINHNPCKHGVTDDYKSYPWSSYRMIVSDKPTQLKREEVFSWYKGRQAFIDYHDHNHNLDNLRGYIMED